MHTAILNDWKNFNHIVYKILLNISVKYLAGATKFCWSNYNTREHVKFLFVFCLFEKKNWCNNSYWTQKHIDKLRETAFRKRKKFMLITKYIDLLLKFLLVVSFQLYKMWFCQINDWLWPYFLIWHKITSDFVYRVWYECMLTGT